MHVIVCCRAEAELNCYCELYACNVSADVFRGKDLRGIILSGGPSSVYEEGAPHVSDSIWALVAACMCGQGTWSCVRACAFSLMAVRLARL